MTMIRQSGTGDVLPPIVKTREVYLCPNCHGQTTVQKPPWVAGNQPVWLGYGTPLYPCPTCGAKGYIVVEPPL